MLRYGTVWDGVESIIWSLGLLFAVGQLLIFIQSFFVMLFFLFFSFYPTWRSTGATRPLLNAPSLSLSRSLCGPTEACIVTTSTR